MIDRAQAPLHQLAPRSRADARRLHTRSGSAETFCPTAPIPGLLARALAQHGDARAGSVPAKSFN